MASPGKEVSKENTGHSSLFVLVTAVFITSLITANIIAVKLVSIFGLLLPAAVIIFPISYICGDVLTEVYGFKRARQVIWLGFLCNLIVVLAIWVTQVLPAASFWDAQGAYDRILGFVPRILVASFVAYLIGEFANSFILAKMKIATKGKHLWTRTIGSTLIGQGLDSAVFISIAFWGVMPKGVLLGAVITQWLFKCSYEAAATPLTYVVVNYLKRKEEVDVYDYDTKFNPLLITD